MGRVPASASYLLVVGGAIESFYAEHPCFERRICAHFSGALFSEAIHGAHPLTMFSNSLYDLETYRSIPFIFKKGRRSFANAYRGSHR